MPASKAVINLGLERISALLSHLPAYTRPTCHIAGTNGKGSVTALLSSILQASSYRVGRFNSPHLVSIHDSITINSVPVSNAKYVEIRQRVEAVDSEYAVGASNFELLTATALSIFEDAAVDIAVIEVGMGGRLDATNVISDDQILVSALTAVDLDHQAFLGNTVQQIAAEKAAIARGGRPFVLGPQSHPEVDQVVREVVAKVGGTLVETLVPSKREKRDPALDGQAPSINLLSPDFVDAPQPVVVDLPPFSTPISLLLPLKGDHQLQNLGIALSIVSALLTQPNTSLEFPRKITLETIAKGVKDTSWPGRLSFHTIDLPQALADPESRSEAIAPSTNTSRFLVLADGAHNPASSKTLASFIDDTFASRFHSPPTAEGPITLSYILALSHSPPKKAEDTLAPLLSTSRSWLQNEERSDQPTVRVRIAFVRFTPPDGMPWVRSEPPSKLKTVVSPLLPQAEFWATPDSDSEPAEDLKRAFNWVTRDQHAKGNEGLIVIAGSLYLVADFYRLLRS